MFRCLRPAADRLSGLTGTLMLFFCVLSTAAEVSDNPYRLELRFSDFSLNEYLAEHDPQWLPHADIISHFSGVHSVNPLALLAAVEHSREPSLAASLTDHSRQQTLLRIEQIEQLAIALASYGQTASTIAAPEQIVDTRFRARVDELVRRAKRPTRPALRKNKPSFSLPTRYLQNWQFNGVHTNNGLNDGSAMSAIDLAGNWAQFWSQDVSEFKVAAAHDGVATVFSQCFVLITHDSGWMTGYYHLNNITVANGQQVRAGQIIAEYANTPAVALCNGGHSDRPHLHFSLRFNGTHMPLHDNVFSGYRVNSGAFDYDINPALMYLEKNGIRHYAFQQFVYNDTPVAAAPIDYRFNGMWYQPEYAGHGLNLVVSRTSDSQPDSQTVFVTLFSYDDDGQANFYTGNISTSDWLPGVPLEIPMLQTAHGGFTTLTAIDFQSDATAAGSLTLTLNDCQTGQLSYQLIERSTATVVTQSHDIIRLIGVPQSECPLTSP